MWARILIYGGFAGIMSVCAFLAWSVVRAQAPDSWLGAAVALFAAIFPLMVVVLIATTIHTGIKAIRDHTDRFLIETIPATLERIPEDVTSFAPLRPHYSSASRTCFADIRISHRKGDCFADYEITYPDEGRSVSLTIRIELNVRRLNFNLYLPTGKPLENVLQAAGAASASDLTLEHLRDAVFRHTLNATVGAGQVSLAQGDSSGSVSYVFHREVFSRLLDGQRRHVLVATCALPRDVLWNPAERLFVAQDLMFMVRALASEGAELFVA